MKAKQEEPVYVTDLGRMAYQLEVRERRVRELEGVLGDCMELNRLLTALTAYFLLDKLVKTKTARVEKARLAELIGKYDVSVSPAEGAYLLTLTEQGGGDPLAAPQE